MSDKPPKNDELTRDETVERHRVEAPEANGKEEVNGSFTGGLEKDTKEKPRKRLRPTNKKAKKRRAKHMRQDRKLHSPHMHVPLGADGKPILPERKPYRKKRKWYWRVVRVAVQVFLWLIGIFAVLTLLISLPAIQNKFLPWANQRLSRNLNTVATIGEVNIGFPDKIVLYDVYIEDQAGRKAISADKIEIGLIHLPLMKWVFGSSSNVTPIAARFVQLDYPELNIIIHPEGHSNLDFMFEGEEDTTETETQYLFDFPDLNIKQLALTLIDSSIGVEELVNTPGHLNWENLAIDELDLEASVEMLVGKRLRAYISYLSMSERHSGFYLKRLKTDIETDLETPQATDRLTVANGKVPYVNLLKTEIELGETVVKADFRLRNETFGTFWSDSLPKDYEITLAQSHIRFQDLNFFPEEDLPLQGEFDVEGKVFGDPTRLRAKGLRLDYQRNTHIITDFYLTDYTSSGIFIDAQLARSTIDLGELNYLLRDNALPEELLRMGQTRVDGRFLGFVEDFVVQAELEGSYGQVVSDLNLKIPERGPLVYRGRLQTHELNVDTLLGTEVSDRLNFDGTVYGVGSNWQELNTTFDFQLQPSNLFGYAIDSVRGSMTARNRSLDGTINVLDAEGDFSGKLTVNQSESPGRYAFFGDVQNVDLQHYGVVSDSLLLTSIFNINLSGDSLEALTGYVRAFETDLMRRGTDEEITVRDIVIRSRGSGPLAKDIVVQSELLDLDLTGTFTYEQGYELVNGLATEVALYWEGDSAAIDSYYTQKPLRATPLELDYTLDVKQLNKLLRYLRSPLRVSEDTHSDAYLTAENDADLRFNFVSPHLSWADMEIGGMDVKYRFHKDGTSNGLQSEGVLQVGSFLTGEDGTLIEDIFLESFLLNKRLDYTLSLTQDSSRKELLLEATTQFTSSGFEMHIDENTSSLALNDSTWFFEPGSYVAYAPGYLQVHDFGLYKLGQQVTVFADIDSAKGTDMAVVRSQNLELTELAQLLDLGYSMVGKVDAELQVQDLLEEQPLLRINGAINGFVFEETPYGDLTAKSNWSERLQRLFLDISMVRDEAVLLSLQGYYDATKKESPLDFALVTDNFPAELITPFVQDYLFEMDGALTLSGLKVTGTLSEPKLRGNGQLQNVSFGVDYLQTRYVLNGSVEFYPRAVTMPGIQLTDEWGQTAWLGGQIRHDYLSNFVLDLHLDDIRSFTLINTQADDNDLFYGRAVLRSGFANITGPIDLVTIDARVQSGKGTRIYIPVTSYSTNERLPYVYFRTSREDSTNFVAQVEELGLNFNLEIEATPDAEIQLILDERTDEKIVGRGTGVLTMTIPNIGEMTLNGSYELSEGSYTLNLENLVRKPFVMEPGSTLRWAGDPYDAQLDMTAVYHVPRATLALGELSSGSTVPVDVMVNLGGLLSAPVISFDLETVQQNQGQGGSSDLLVDSYLRSIESDQAELLKQVVSLLAFSRFSPQGSFFASGTDAGVSSSLTSAVSNLVSSTLGKAFGSSNFDVNLSTNQFNDLNLSFNAGFFDNRLIIERDGALVNRTSQDFTIGNLTARYRLLPTRKADSSAQATGNAAYNPMVLSFEVFRRENLSLTNSVQSTNTGAGIFIRKEFDNFSELFGRKKRKRATRQSEQPAPADSNSAPADTNTTGTASMFRFRQAPEQPAQTNEPPTKEPPDPQAKPEEEEEG